LNSFATFASLHSYTFTKAHKLLRLKNKKNSRIFFFVKKILTLKNA